MRYRLAAFSLAVVLGVLPGLTTIPAAPLPEKLKTPTIYALVYVGLSKNDPGNAERIDVALKSLRSCTGAVRDPKVKALAIVREKDPTVRTDKEHKRENWIERDDWAQNNTRTASLDGTAVVRVWFTDGSPEEQVVIVNAIAREYVKDQQEIFRNALKELERYKADFKKNQERAGARVTEEDDRVFGRKEWAIKHLPYVIEWANLPEKP